MSDSIDETTRLADFFAKHRRIVALSGAGCSTASGIPDYRDRRGEWKRASPVMYQEFMTREEIRRRYWSRSMIGWPHFEAARPNGAHGALAALERHGPLFHLLTQNVDGLHRRAGSIRVTELHGSLASVSCLECALVLPRAAVQRTLERQNPEFIGLRARLAPDGDADPEDRDLARFRVPDCPRCRGVLKPDVVFFGESVAPSVVKASMELLERADALFCVGTSLMVYSGFRFCRRAVELGIPIVALNEGRTRADELLTHKIDAQCAPLLEAVASRYA